MSTSERENSHTPCPVSEAGVLSRDAVSGTSDPIPEDVPARVIDSIRKSSRDGSLLRLSSLCSLFPDQDIEYCVQNSDATDLGLIRGVRDTYYFSDLSMTETYAVHLFRIEERDPVRLVADTVRDESRIYPRPTYVSTFLDSPFFMKPAEIEETIARIAMRPDTTDIKECESSNGVKFLYSSLYLEETHATGLAEFFEVVQRENP